MTVYSDRARKDEPPGLFAGITKSALEEGGIQAGACGHLSGKSGGLIDQRVPGQGQARALRHPAQVWPLQGHPARARALLLRRQERVQLRREERVPLRV